MDVPGRVYDVFTKGGTCMPKSASSDEKPSAPSKVQAVEHDLVDVALDVKHTVTVAIKDVRVEFVDGIATVRKDIAQALKDSGLVK